MSRLYRRGRAGDCQAVAPGDDRDAELPLNPVEVLVAFAVKQREQQVVVEFQLSAPFGELAVGDRGRERCHIATPSTTDPERLLALAPDINVGTIFPIRSADAATWTL